MNKNSKISIFHFVFILIAFGGCNKKAETVQPKVETKTVISTKTTILTPADQSNIISINDNEIIIKGSAKGKLNAETYGPGSNIIITPNKDYFDGIARNIISVSDNGNNTFTAKTDMCQIDQVCESLNEKATVLIDPSTINKIYKPNGDELPYSINGNIGIVPIAFTFPIKDKADKKFAELEIKGSIEFNGSMDFAVVMNKNTKYWISKVTLQDKEKLTASLSTSTEKKVIKIDKNKSFQFGDEKFDAKPFIATIPLFETKLAPVMLGPAFWITPLLKFYVKIEGDAQGQISVTILERDGGKTIRWDEYTDTQGWKTETEKVSPGSTKTFSNLELEMVGKLAMTPTFEISGSPWGYEKVVEIGTTIGLESKLEASVAADLPAADLYVKLSGSGSVKVGGKVKINAIWKSLVDWEPAIKIGSNWELFKPLKYYFGVGTAQKIIPEQYQADVTITDFSKSPVKFIESYNTSVNKDGSMRFDFSEYLGEYDSSLPAKNSYLTIDNFYDFKNGYEATILFKATGGTNFYITRTSEFEIEGYNYKPLQKTNYSPIGLIEFNKEVIGVGYVGSNQMDIINTKTNSIQDNKYHTLKTAFFSTIEGNSYCSIYLDNNLTPIYHAEIKNKLSDITRIENSKRIGLNFFSNNKDGVKHTVEVKNFEYKIY